MTYGEIDLDMTLGTRLVMTLQTDGHRVMPQNFLGEFLGGGCKELYTMEQRAQLDRFLSPDG